MTHRATVKSTHRRTSKGDLRREAILQVAVNIASAEGLEGLSMGRLATEAGMSKSGLFAHFGSKQELQLATIEAARSTFIENVVRPARAGGIGFILLWRLCDAWLSYSQRRVFRGGCFFSAAAAEFDSRPGPIRDRIAEIMNEWIGALNSAARQAQEQGHLRPTVDPAQIAFELHSLTSGANSAFYLHGDARVFDWARASIRDRLGSLATASAPELPASDSHDPEAGNQYL